MDVRRLLILREVARAGSISGGARALGWTQPAVSQHIRALERSLGCAVVLRAAGGITLTEPGRVLLARADAVAAQLHMASEEIAELTTLRRGRVRLAAYPSAAATLVPRALARLRERHPELDIELTEAEPPEALPLLAAGDVDVALVFDYQGGDGDAGAAGELHEHPLGEENVVLVLPDAHPASGAVRLSDLADEDWVVGCERCRAHTVLRCAEAGFVPRVRHVSDDYVVVQNLVAAGLGVTMLPASALTAYRHPEVRTVEGFGTRRLSAVHRLGADAVPATAALVRELDAARDHRLA